MISKPTIPEQTAPGSVSGAARSPLPDAGGGLADGLRDPERIGVELAETLVPRWADHAVVHLLDEVISEADAQAPEAAGPPAFTVVHRVAVAHSPASVRPDSFLFAGTILRLPADAPVLISLSKGHTVHVPHVDAFTADHLAAQLRTPLCANFLQGCAVLLMPLMAGEKVLGNVMLVRDPRRPAFDDDAAATLTELTKWAAWSIDTARIHARQTRLVAELRQGLLPDLPQRLADVQVCWRYLPESRTDRIGGDWFDAIPLGDGRIALVIGDVMGHGVNAAMVMSRCKTLVRTLVLLGLSPDEVLRRFDRHFGEVACLSGDDHVATCLVVFYDPAKQQCQAANAGHIQPILVHPDGRREILDIPTGAPIGAGGPGFRPRAVPTSHGSILALCTDGFAVLHHTDIDQALTRLSAALTDPGRPLDEICESAFRGIDLEARGDDVTLLLARLPGGAAPESVT
ncbi:MAG TPA: SpoIIE family protein phosphatase [Streptosporangiaceae bacterium]|nr:SpoIIE family protein phosphatase [Streptosporangiaceae bacterium]